MASKKEFVEFKKKFTQYQEKFGLMGWQVHFAHEPIDDFAIMTALTEDRVATVTLNMESDPEDREHVMVSAKHEALHLLMAIYCKLAHDRYARPSEIHQAEEEIVVKLTRLIPDI